MAKATQLYVAGVQDLGKQTMAMVQGLADQAIAGAKALSTVKSLKEAAEIQATYTRAAMERSLRRRRKLQEAALKLVETSFAPLSARMTLAVEKFVEAARRLRQRHGATGPAGPAARHRGPAPAASSATAGRGGPAGPFSFRQAEPPVGWLASFR